MSETPRFTPAHKERVWIALSSEGFPVPFIGFAFTRKTLTSRYEETYRHTLKKAGYRVARAQLTVLPRKGKAR